MITTPRSHCADEPVPLWPCRSGSVRRWLFALLCLSWFSGAGAAAIHAQSRTARITGTVVDPSGHVLPGVAVTLDKAEDEVSAGGARVTTPVGSTTSDDQGAFVFNALSADTYVISAELSGFSRAVHPPIEVLDGQSVDLQLLLALAPLSEVVNVVGSTGAGNPLEEDTVRNDFLQVFQLPTDRFQEALPLLPGVVRDPKGRLSFNGTRPSQSTLLVNGTNATDPVTGQFAFELPLSVIDTVEVHAIPYSAEFGRVSGAVADVRTVAGDDHWDVDVRSLIPDPRFRGGTLQGIDTATPRVKVSGPLRQGKVWFSQAFSYRFVRSQVKEEIPGNDEEIAEGFDTFTQVDVKLSDRHSITGTLSVFPADIDNLGINSLNLADASPNLETDGWNVALLDEFATGPNSLWRTQFALRRFDLAVRPTGSGPARLTPDGLRNNYFNEIDRESRQIELNTARLQSWRQGPQEHLVKFGAQLLATSFDGTDRSGAIEMVGADGRLLTRITFQGPGTIDASDVVSSAFVQDHWRVHPRLALDLGLRFDHDAMLSQGHLSPRTAFSLRLDAEGRRIIKGGWGVFFDQVFLQVDAFDQFQQRVEQPFGGSADTPLGPAVIFENRVAAEGLEKPTSHVWNVELDQQFGEALLLRLNYREHRAQDRPVVDLVTEQTGSALVLSWTGTLTAREFDATLRWTPRFGELYVSFSKIRSSSDLNDFGDIYDTLRDPLVLPNEQSLQPFDVPNRVLVWGVVTLPGGFVLTPGIEWRTGFPYTIFTEDYAVVGERNRAEFPSFFSADVALTKRVRLFGRQVDLGVQSYNLTSHDNPRDVVSNLGSSQFGTFRNSVGNTIALKLGLGL